MTTVRRLRRLPVRLLGELWLPAVLLAAWFVLSESSTSPFFPPLRQILDSFGEIWLGPGFQENVVPSMTNLGVGLGGAVVTGLVVGVLLGWSPRWSAVADPYVQFMRAVPSLALLPVLFVLIGTGMAGKVTAIFFGALWPILLNTIDGVRGIEPGVRLTATSYRLGRWLVLTRVLLPGALPQAAVGIRTGLSIAVIVMVGSEMFATTAGMGRFIILSQQTFAIAEMWSGILMMGIIGYLLNAGFNLLERWLLRWRPRTDPT